MLQKAKDNLSILIINILTSWCLAVGCTACPTFLPFLQAPPAQSFYKQTEHSAERVASYSVSTIEMITQIQTLFQCISLGIFSISVCEYLL